MRKRSPIIVCSTIFAAVVIVLLIHMYLNPLPNEYYIFQNIEECSKLIPDNLSDINFNQYDTPSADKDLKELLYDNFFGMKFESDTLEYEIFAYEFEDSDSALKYYVNVTGQNRYEKKLPLDEQDENKLLSASKGMFSYRVVVIYKNRAYKLIAPNKYVDEIHALLGEVFSQKLQ